MPRPKGNGGTYPPQTVDTALLVYMRAANSVEAAKQLNEQGIPVAANTLRYWTNPGGPHHERWLQLWDQHGQEIDEEAVANARHLSALAHHKMLNMLEAFNPKALDARDVPGALRNLATTQSLQHDKIINPIIGRPTQPHGELDPQQVMASLVRSGVLKVDATVEAEDAKEIEA